MRTARTEPGPVADEARSSSVSAESGRTDGPGEIIDADNAQSRLQMRNFMETMRLSGEEMGGPKAFNDRDKHRFAAALDRWLATTRSSR